MPQAGSGSFCAVAGCKNSSRKMKAEGRNDLSFHRFPKNLDIMKKWMEACRRSGKWNPTTSFICSDHFKPSDFKRDLKAELLKYTPRQRFIKENAIPSEKLPPYNFVQKPRRLQKVRARKSNAKDKPACSEDIRNIAEEVVHEKEGLTGRIEEDPLDVRNNEIKCNSQEIIFMEDVKDEPIESIKTLVDNAESVINSDSNECQPSCRYKSLLEAEQQKYEFLSQKYSECLVEINNIKCKLKKKRDVNIKLRTKIYGLENKVANLIKDKSICIVNLKDTKLQTESSHVKQSGNDLLAGSLFSKIFSECQMKIMSEAQSRVNCTLEENSDHSL